MLTTKTLRNDIINISVLVNQFLKRVDSIQGIKARINLSAIKRPKNIGTKTTPNVARKVFTILIFIFLVFVLCCLTPIIQSLFDVICNFGVFNCPPELS